MISVLIVEDDSELRRTLVRDLSQRDDMSVFSAEDYATGVNLLINEDIDILLTDLRLGERDGIDLLRNLQRLSPKTRAVLMSAYATARDHQEATQLGAIQVLCKPFSRREFLDAIQQAIESRSGYSAQFYGLSITDVLQMFHHAQRDLKLLIMSGPQGEIHMRSGQIVHAETEDGVRGEAALALLLGSGGGALQTQVMTPSDTKRSISKPFGMLLLDTMRVIDEKNSGNMPAIETESSGFDLEITFGNKKVPTGLSPLPKPEASSGPFNPFEEGEELFEIDINLNDVDEEAPPGEEPISFDEMQSLIDDFEEDERLYSGVHQRPDELEVDIADEMQSLIDDLGEDEPEDESDLGAGEDHAERLEVGASVLPRFGALAVVDIGREAVLDLRSGEDDGVEPGVLARTLSEVASATGVGDAREVVLMGHQDVVGARQIEASPDLWVMITCRGRASLGMVRSALERTCRWRSDT